MSTPLVGSPSDSPGAFTANRRLRYSNASDADRRERVIAAAKDGIRSSTPTHERRSSAPSDPQKAWLKHINSPKKSKGKKANKPKRQCDIKAQEWVPPLPYEQSDTLVLDPSAAEGKEPGEDDDAPLLLPASKEIPVQSSGAGVTGEPTLPRVDANHKNLQEVSLSPPPTRESRVQSAGVTEEPGSPVANASPGDLQEVPLSPTPVRESRAQSEGQGDEPASPVLCPPSLEDETGMATASMRLLPLKGPTTYGTEPQSQQTEKIAWYIECFAWCKNCGC